jgi:two-component system, NarL family, nitrate/nitrite response regulator NarL
MSARVLVVDDDPAFLVAARRLLRAHGLLVVGEAGTAADGLTAAMSLRPDGVLVDVCLPDADGTVLARGLIDAAWHPRLLLTSSDPDALGPDALGLDGSIGFLPKEELADAPLRRLLARE